MRRWTVFWIALVLAGCGSREEKPAKPAAATPTKPVAVTAARTAEQCQDLWNQYARGGIEDYLVEARATQAFVDFFNGECIVMAPVEPGARRVYIWVARDGRAPWGLPSQDTLPAGRDLKLNARVTEEGTLE